MYYTYMLKCVCGSATRNFKFDSNTSISVERKMYQEFVQGQDILHFSFEQVQVDGILGERKWDLNSF